MSKSEPIRLTRAQVREIDRRAIEEFHIPGIVLMENAARAVADVAMQYIRRAQFPQTLIVCGGGNNGGDGLAAARHLHNRGAPVMLALAADPEKFSGEALINWQICRAMRLPLMHATPDRVLASGCMIVIDALFGTGLAHPPRPPFDDLIASIMMMGAEVIAVDLPSGLDCDTGEPLGENCIAAAHTVTFVAEKAGFASARSRQFTGDITVAEIGCPVELIRAIAEAP